jgi:hypothetical protein
MRLLSIEVALLPYLAGALILGATEIPLRFFDAPPECPDRAYFLSRLADRVANVDPRVTLEVSISRSRSAVFEGNMRVFREQNAFAPRQLTSTDCTELTDGLVLIAALALEAAHLPAEPSEVIEAVELIEAIERAPPLSPANKVRASFSRASGSVSVRGYQPAFGVQIALLSGALPGVAVSVPVFAELSEPNAGTYRIAFEWSSGDTADGRAHFLLLAGRVSACPWTLESADVRFEPCAGLKAGVLSARGIDVSNPAREKRGWLAVGPLARVKWLIFGPMFLEAEGGLFAPLIRDRFYFAPDIAVHEPNRLTAELRLGAGFVLW